MRMFLRPQENRHKRPVAETQGDVIFRRIMLGQPQSFVFRMLLLL